MADPDHAVAPSIHELEAEDLETNGRAPRVSEQGACSLPNGVLEFAALDVDIGPRLKRDSEVSVTRT